MAMNLGECTPEGQPTLELDFFRPETRLDYSMVGWNYRMSTAQAAIGLGQLARFEAIRARRAANGAYLREHLARIPGLKPQSATPGCATWVSTPRGRSPTAGSDAPGGWGSSGARGWRSDSCARPPWRGSPPGPCRWRCAWAGSSAFSIERPGCCATPAISAISAGAGR